jgi:predicted short-subunit dehydrogenase-like oxidoreductase (DUF2520 family)
MPPSDKPRLGFIGIGKVAGTLARLLHTHGYPIGGLWNRTPHPANTLAQHVNATAHTTPIDVCLNCDLVFLTVADDALPSLAANLAATGKALRSAIVHTSGAHNAQVLNPLVTQGASIGALHPAYPFATDTMPSLNGVTFALEADDPALRTWLTGIVAALGGQALWLGPKDRPLYHAALVMTSNYTVALYAAAQRLLSQLGASQAALDSALLALLDATAHNIRTRGIPDALTGPLLRADLHTVEAHLGALKPHADVYRAYLALARLTLPVVEARGVDTAPIQAFLHQKESS